MNDQAGLALSSSENAIRLIGNEYRYREGWPIDLLSIQARALARLGITTRANEQLAEARNRMMDTNVVNVLTDEIRRADLILRLDLAEAELLALSGQPDAAAEIKRDALSAWIERSGLATLTPGIQTLSQEAERVIAQSVSIQQPAISER